MQQAMCPVIAVWFALGAPSSYATNHCRPLSLIHANPTFAPSFIILGSSSYIAPASPPSLTCIPTLHLYITTVFSTSLPPKRLSTSSHSSPFFVLNLCRPLHLLASWNLNNPGPGLALRVDLSSSSSLFILCARWTPVCSCRSSRPRTSSSTSNAPNSPALSDP